MRFKIGDVIFNKATQEEGRIVRIAHIPSGNGYIVSIVPDQTRNMTKEALWRESDVRKAGGGSQSGPIHRAVTRPKKCGE